VPADDTKTFVAGPGKQLAIVDVPPGIPIDSVTHDFHLTFQQRVPAGTGPTAIKAIATGRVAVNGRNFYPPFLPCTTDFTAVPPIVMPRGGQVPLTLPSGLTGCANARYSYFRAESGPPKTCDLDNDFDIDRNDIALVMAVKNAAAAPGDPRDVNHDGVINADDGRVCTAQCTRLRCAP
jgi:hypothetical protein